MITYYTNSTLKNRIKQYFASYLANNCKDSLSPYDRLKIVLVLNENMRTMIQITISTLVTVIYFISNNTKKQIAEYLTQ